MSQPTMLIIGAGVAGLCAGVYAQKSGFQSRIVEMHASAGGLCTSWTRRGYTFDGCLHWLCGTRPGSPFHRLWREVGVLSEAQQIVDHEEFTRVVGPAGQTLIVYTDVERLERHLLELSPADAVLIKELTDGIRLFGRLEMAIDKPAALMGVLEKASLMAKLLPYLGPMQRYTKMTVGEFAARFRDPFLRMAFPAVFPATHPIYSLMTSLGQMGAHDAGYPIGGSRAFAGGIEESYRSLGGQVQYKARVERILVERGQAVGVRLADGTDLRADYVLSAADGRATLFDMLGGQYLSEMQRHCYSHLKPNDSLVQVSLGVAWDMSGEPHAQAVMLDAPMQVPGAGKVDELNFSHYSYDPTLAPAGKSVVIAFLPGTLAWWQAVREESEARYAAEKQVAAQAVIEAIDRRLPGFAAQVEVIDVATPCTYVRYTGNWAGSIQSWDITPESLGLMTSGKEIGYTAPGLSHFYMAGQWTSPIGGVPVGVMSGRQVLMLASKEAGVPFQAGS